VQSYSKRSTCLKLVNVYISEHVRLLDYIDFTDDGVVHTLEFIYEQVDLNGDGEF
jgi:hypothetical protein